MILPAAKGTIWLVKTRSARTEWLCGFEITNQQRIVFQMIRYNQRLFFVSTKLKNLFALDINQVNRLCLRGPNGVLELFYLSPGNHILIWWHNGSVFDKDVGYIKKNQSCQKYYHMMVCRSNYCETKDSKIIFIQKLID